MHYTHEDHAMAYMCYDNILYQEKEFYFHRKYKIYILFTHTVLKCYKKLCVWVFNPLPRNHIIIFTLLYKTIDC